MIAYRSFYRHASASLILLAMLSLMSATHQVDAAEPKPYPLTTCIVSCDKIDPSVPPIVYNNQQIRFCCKSCIKKFQACPDKYMIGLQGADVGKGKGKEPKPKAKE